MKFAFGLFLRQLNWSQNFLPRRLGKISFQIYSNRRNSFITTPHKDVSNSKMATDTLSSSITTTTTTKTASQAFRVVIACLKIIFIAHFFCEYVYCIQPTIGASMLPTLQVLGDNVLIARSYRRGRGVQVGDVVSFASVIKPGERVIKRVIGLPGDWVLRDTPPGSSSSKMLQVPDGHCWLVGDNLEYSRDSRHYGPVPLALIYGKVVAVVFPWKERRWLNNSLTQC